jgi:hypothetical protein
MKPDISIIPVGRRWTYVVVIATRNYSITIEGTSTYGTKTYAMYTARKIGSQYI